MNILLGLTGSVATILAEKTYNELSKVGDVKVVATEKAMKFIWSAASKKPNTNLIPPEKFYTDDKEWQWKQLGDPVQHIELSDWADVLVIAPLSANTLAKMVNGICDNLLTCIWMAWDKKKQVVVAPAMNTRMWENRITQSNLEKLEALNFWKRPNPNGYAVNYRPIPDYNISIVDPVEKKLACGTIGIGAMAPIETIIAKIKVI